MFLIIIMIFIIILVIISIVFTKIALSTRDYDRNCRIDIEGVSLTIIMVLFIIIIIITGSLIVCNYNNCRGKTFYAVLLLFLFVLVYFICRIVPAHKKLKKNHRDVRLLSKWQKSNNYDDWEQSAIDLKIGKNHKIRKGLDKLRKCEDCECVAETFSYMFN